MKKTLHTSFGIKLTSLVTVMLFLFTFQTKTNAQAVDYAIKWKHGYDLGDTLTVYMRSATTINFPFNQVSTAQVTLRVPQNMLPFFDGSDKSTVTIPDTLIGHNNGLWSNNARFNVGQTTNNTDQYILGTLQDHQDGNFYDYISFGLTSLGTRNIEFVAGEELPLFSFIFPYTTLCVDSIPIQILDHVLDSSFLENGVTSPNNNISVLGAGGDIYSGNYFTEYGARCYDYDNDDVYNPDDACDYTTLEHIEDGIVDSLGCTDLDGDGFYIDDNPTAEDQDSRTSTRPDTLGDAPIETYNEYDTDITSKCVPQGDSIIADLYVYTAAGAEFTNGSTTICAGDQIELRISINETESTGDANESSNPYDYDHRGGYTVTVNSDLSGDFTVPISGTDTVIFLQPTEDGATYSLVQVLDTFLCSAIEMNNEGQIFLNEGVTLATIDGDAALCGTEDSVDIEIDLVQGTAPFTVTYGAEGADTTTITMTDRNEIITVAVNSSRTYRLISVVDNGGCPTPAGALIGSAIIEFTDLAALDVADVTMTLPSDCGAEDGTITVDSTGFGSGTEFSINGGVTWSTDPSFTGLGAGNYVVAARKDNSDECIVTVDSIYAMASSTSPVFSSLTETQPTDCSANTGSIEVAMQSVPSGLVVEYQLVEGATIIQDWAAGSVENALHEFSNVPDGTYAINVRYNTSAGGPSPTCQVSYPGGAEINAISAPTANTPLVNNATDCDETDGSITIAATSDGGFPLEYRWVTGTASSAWGSQNVFLGLQPDTYTIEVRNAGTTNCVTTVAAQTITRPDSVYISNIAKTNIVDCGLEDGTITVTSGSDNPLAAIEYSIDGGNTWSTDPAFTGLGAGIYNVSIRNNDQTCEVPSSRADTITAPEEILQINPGKLDVTDCGADDGRIIGQVASFDSDSTIHYDLIDIQGSITIPNFAQDTFSGLSGGDYSLIVKYPNGACADTIDVSIAAPDTIDAEAFGINSENCDATEGEISFNVTQAGDAVQFTIDGGTNWQQSNTFTGLSGGSYDVQVRYVDQTCFKDLDDVTLTDPVPVAINVPDVSTAGAGMCGNRDTIVIDTASFTGANYEFSIDGQVFQQDTFFPDLRGGSYLLTVRNSLTPTCFDTLTVTVDANDAPIVQARALLQGPYNFGTGVMNDDLRDMELLPTSNPYTSTSLAGIGADNTTSGYGFGGQPHLDSVDLVNDMDVTDHGITNLIDTTVAGHIFEDYASNSVVDWVLMEIRPESNPAQILSRVIGLLQRDGDIVTWKDGESPLEFRNACATPDEKYHVSIKHRNHSGIMTAEALTFGEDAVNVDFTSTDLPLYRMESLPIPQEPAAVLPNGKRALWGGNVAFNRRVLFQGNLDDSGLIGKAVTEDGTNPDAIANFILDGYYNSDVNMDGVTIFQGAPNDVDIIFFNIMGNPANTNFAANFTLREQLPENE